MSSQTVTAPETPTILHRVVSIAAFWGVVLLPLTYLPLLYGTSGTERLLALVAILGLNALCLLVDQTI